MVDELQMARKEEEGRPVLLASSGSRASGEPSSGRAQGRKTTTDSKGDEGGKAKNPKKASKGNAKAKGGGRRGRRRGRSYSLRESARTTEGDNRPSGRSAKELGIEWLGDRCEKSPVTKAHFLIGMQKVDGGVLFKCKYCHHVKWLPVTDKEAVRLANWMKVYGEDGGYQRILDLHPTAKRLIAKVQDIYYLQKVLPVDQFAVAVAAVMLDNEYPFESELGYDEDEEML